MASTQTEEVQGVAREGTEKLGADSSGSVAKGLIVPAAVVVGSLAATYAARKGAKLLKRRAKAKLEEKASEEAVQLGEKAAQKLPSLGGPLVKAIETVSGGASGSKKTRRLPIQRWTDIGAPLDVVYERWTAFEEFPKFMHRVLSVKEKDRNKLSWEEKIWFSRRQWEGEITDQRKNDRIAWKTTSGTSHSGMVTFHKLDTNLTRVLVTVDFHPSGMVEKMASGLRFVKRAVEADLARFKAYCELGDAKGLDYAQPGELEGTQDDRGRAQSKSNGSGNGSGAAEAKSNDEREQSRQERAERREDRRGS
jgi:uncharacterized membrane protein